MSEIINTLRLVFSKAQIVERSIKSDEKSIPKLEGNELQLVDYEITLIESDQNLIEILKGFPTDP